MYAVITLSYSINMECGYQVVFAVVFKGILLRKDLFKAKPFRCWRSFSRRWNWQQKQISWALSGKENQRKVYIEYVKSVIKKSYQKKHLIQRTEQEEDKTDEK